MTNTSYKLNQDKVWVDTVLKSIEEGRFPRGAMIVKDNITRSIKEGNLTIDLSNYKYQLENLTDSLCKVTIDIHFSLKAKKAFLSPISCQNIKFSDQVSIVMTRIIRLNSYIICV
jgi:hypothetical protein